MILSERRIEIRATSDEEEEEDEVAEKCNEGGGLPLLLTTIVGLGESLLASFSTSGGGIDIVGLALASACYAPTFTGHSDHH